MAARLSPQDRSRWYLNDNARWLARMMSQRRLIIDIGPVPGSGPSHKAYLMEFALTIGYPGTIRAWGFR